MGLFHRKIESDHHHSHSRRPTLRILSRFKLNHSDPSNSVVLNHHHQPQVAVEPTTNPTSNSFTLNPSPSIRSQSTIPSRIRNRTLSLKSIFLPSTNSITTTSTSTHFLHPSASTSAIFINHSDPQIDVEELANGENKPNQKSDLPHHHLVSVSSSSSQLVSTTDLYSNSKSLLNHPTTSQPTSPNPSLTTDTLHKNNNMINSSNSRRPLSQRSTSTPLSILSSKLKVIRKKKANSNDLYKPVQHSNSSRTSLPTTASLELPPPSVPKSPKTPEPSQDLKKVQDTEQSNLSSPASSFQLKSFRNVRTSSAPGFTINTSSSTTTTNSYNHNPTTTTSTPTSPAPTSYPLIQLSRTLPNAPSSSSIHCSTTPSSPTVRPGPRISAAAFREARAARTTSRTSLYSTYSDRDPASTTTVDRSSLHQKTNSNQSNRTRYTSHPSPSRASSDPPFKKPEQNRRNMSTPLSYPTHHTKGLYSLSSQTNDETDGLLVPPRPAFYGSRPPSLYSNHTSTSSQASIKSLPISHRAQSSRVLSSTSSTKTPTKKKLPNQLDKWHSDDDEEEDERTPTNKKISANNSDSDEEDLVPLSKLRQSRRSSIASSKTTHSTLMPPPPPPPPPPPVPLLAVSLPPLLRQQQHRGNSPCSSSSGSGSWTTNNTPITPRDSSLIENLNNHAIGHINYNNNNDQLGPLSLPPAGVDPYIYNNLGLEQKIQLHHRSQMMIQMMAAQAQMHALSLHNQGVGSGGGSSLGIPIRQTTMNGYRNRTTQSVIGIPSSRPQQPSRFGHMSRSSVNGRGPTTT
ncbi:hypothetical protein CROQUDRAFT_104445 [Cronartium quercuum f. sp. fusiforme G11]|uniref:Uncharacterized protein n=1 Tax=Cronartium quercuum f. sp. fusiforme G11 TaxID=708437 RepID=A0A9P6NRK1_9BASI|nr:hypothetical protein CROQUDRAFT_104445 [Cronartium quercuum f. sp. fusiforme G11]